MIKGVRVSDLSVMRFIDLLPCIFEVQVPEIRTDDDPLKDHAWQDHLVRLLTPDYGLSAGEARILI